MEDYLTDEAMEELEAIAKESSTARVKRRLLRFFEQEFPGCMALIPVKRRDQFLEGVFRAMEDGRFPTG